MRQLSVSFLWLILVAAPVVAQLTTPTDWRWRLDTPADLVTTLDVPERSWLFVRNASGMARDHRARRVAVSRRCASTDAQLLS